MVIDQLISNIEQLDFTEVISQSVEETTEQFIETQEEQLLHGINARGETIGRYRSRQYAEMKNAQNPLPGYGIVDARLTGAFYEGIVIRTDVDGVVTDSIDQKSGALQQKYPDLLGLSAEYIPQYLEAFEPVAIEQIENKILSP